MPLALRSSWTPTGQSAYGPMLAMSVLALCRSCLFFLAFQRFLLEGTAGSGLKG